MAEIDVTEIMSDDGSKLLGRQRENARRHCQGELTALGRQRGTLIGGPHLLSFPNGSHRGGWFHRLGSYGHPRIQRRGVEDSEADRTPGARRYTVL